MSIAPHNPHSTAAEPVPHAGQSSVAQGFAADASDPASLRRAIELAFDYRGDVTITRKSSPPPAPPIEGYMFDRKPDKDTGEMIVRMIASADGNRLTIPFSDIARIDFTGKDTASGRSFETWVKKYVEKKLAGECAGIDAETLD
jgi:hypothetical protein